MRRLLFALIVPCNQLWYDHEYEKIIKQALNTPLKCIEHYCGVNDPEIFNVRNKAIWILRKKCDGQRSTYEMEREY